MASINPREYQNLNHIRNKKHIGKSIQEYVTGFLFLRGMMHQLPMLQFIFSEEVDVVSHFNHWLCCMIKLCYLYGNIVSWANGNWQEKDPDNVKILAWIVIKIPLYTKLSPEHHYLHSFHMYVMWHEHEDGRSLVFHLYICFFCYAMIWQGILPSTTHVSGRVNARGIIRK